MTKKQWGRAGQHIRAKEEEKRRLKGEIAQKHLQLLMLESDRPAVTAEELALVKAKDIAAKLGEEVNDEAHFGAACHIEVEIDGVKKYLFSVKVEDARALARIHAETPAEADALMASVRYFDPMGNAMSHFRRAAYEMDMEQTVRVLRALGMLTQEGRSVRFGFGHIDVGDTSDQWRPFMLFIAGALHMCEKFGKLTAKEAHDVVEKIMMSAESAAYETYLSKSWETLSPKEQEVIRSAFHTRVVKALQGGGLFETRTRETILQRVSELAEEEVGRRVDEIRARVIAECDKRWEEMVEAVVTRRLNEAVAKVKAEMAR
jgi:hypothetical protein